MLITKWEVQKKNKEKVSVFVDDVYAFSVTMSTFIDEGLCSGMEITEDTIERLKQKDEPQLAFMSIVAYLNYGMKTEYQIVKKMREKGYSSKAISQAVEKAKQYHFIDDVYYTEEYIQNHGKSRKQGEYRIRQDLMQKGIPKELIDEKIEMLYSEEDKYHNAYALAEKKYLQISSEENIYKKRQKIYQFLASKGYSSDIVKSVVEDILENNE